MRPLLPYLGACACSVRPFVGLTAALSRPGCLAGYSADGLPWVAPTIAAAALLIAGWRFWADEAVMWRLIGWGFLLGSSAFAGTPLRRAWPETVAWWPEWETLPLVVVCVALAARCWVALSSRHGLYRLLAGLTAAAVACAVLAPYVPAVAGRWPWAVIGAGYGSLAAVFVVAVTTHHLERRDDVR